MTKPDPNPQVSLFFQRLTRLDAGGRARLKRSAGQPLAGARREALGLFYSLLPPGVPERQQEVYFLAATLYPLADSGGSGDFGATLRRARRDQNAKGIDRRVIALLDADESQLAYRLRRAIFFLQSNRVRINWPALLQDLLAWNSPSRFVQRRWAQSYFQAEQPPAASSQPAASH